MIIKIHHIESNRIENIFSIDLCRIAHVFQVKKQQQQQQQILPEIIGTYVHL